MKEWWMGAFVVMLGAMLGYYLRLIIGRYKAVSSRETSERLISEVRQEAESMRNPIKIKFLSIVSALLLLVAAGGASPACWFNWYQPKSPE